MVELLPNEIRNSNIEIRNKFEFQMIESLRHLNLLI